MNQNRFHGICKQFSGKIKESWGRLINDPLLTAVGSFDQRAGRIEEQCSILARDSERQLKDFMIRNRNWQDLSKH